MNIVIQLVLWMVLLWLIFQLCRGVIVINENLVEIGRELKNIKKELKRIGS